MDTEHKNYKWYLRWSLNEKGRCRHVKDILKDAKPIGVVELDKDHRYDIYSCKTCGYIYCGRLPLKYYLEKA